MPMRKRWTRKACFDFFGVVPRNPRWSWSGRSPEGEPPVVAVTLWQDRFTDDGRVYRSAKQQPNHKPSAGHKEFIENLAWARDKCGRRVRVIVAVAKDPNSTTKREIKICLPPHDKFGM